MPLLLSATAFLVILVLELPALQARALSVIGVTTLLQALMQLYSTSWEMADSLTIYAERSLHFHQVGQFLDISQQVTSEARKQLAPPECIDSIRFSNASFSYDGSTPVLHDVNITLRRGTVTALVGENGSGKTTFVRLLQKLYTVPAGMVFANDADLADIDPLMWRQRFAIARSISRQSDMLVMDEPNSALDPFQEQALWETLRQVSAGKLCLYITHRLAGARLADQIMVMHQGTIIETGRHDELLERKGHYWRLWQQQSSGYSTASA